MKLKPTRAKTPAEAKPAAAGPALSVWLYAAVLALLAAAALGGVTYYARGGAEAVRVEAQRKLDERTADLLAARLEQRLQGDYASLALIARHPALPAALAEGRAALAPLQQTFLTAFPGASRVLILPAGMSEPDLNAKPPLGYALLDMLRQAEQDKRPQPAEVHQSGQPDAHVNLLQPVLAGDRVIGHVLVTYPLEHLKSALSGIGEGRVVLRQGTVDVLQAGAGDGQPLTRPIAPSRWQLAYTGAPVIAAAGGELPLVAGGAGALLLLAILAAFHLLRRRIVQDGDSAVRIVHDFANGVRKVDYPARLNELKPALTGVFAELGKLQDLQPVAPVAAREGRALAEDELPPDIVSGLQVEEAVDAKPAAKPAAPKPAARPAPAAVAKPAPPHALEVVEPSEPEVLLPDTELDFQLPDEPAATATSVAIDPSILRAYDIRGVVGSTLNAEVVRALGQAIGSEAAAANQLEVVVARDGRLSSPELADALIEGLVAAGRDVIDIGRVPTPVMHFATFHLATGAGVMVTGSHNPRDYNGLKIVVDGRTLSGDAIQALGQRVRAGKLTSGKGSVRSEDVLQAYIDRIVQDAALHRPLKIVVDCGNGVAGEVAPQVFRAMGCEVEELFCEVDGYFPNHHPDPTVPDNLEALISLVRLQGADLGLAFDGDGDRLGVVDKKGKIIWADRQLMLFAQDVLTRHPGADIVFDVKCSTKLAELITENAGVPVMWKTGHSLIKNKLLETGAPLAGDLSGHIFFKDRWYGFDDAVYAGARLLELLSMDERSSDAVFAALPDSVATPEIRIDLKEGEPGRIMTALGNVLAKDFKQARITAIDGIRADFPDGWGLVRASNTQPCLVLRFEAKDKTALANLQGEFRKRLLAVKPDLALPF